MLVLVESSFAGESSLVLHARVSGIYRAFAVGFPGYKVPESAVLADLWELIVVAERLEGVER